MNIIIVIIGVTEKEYKSIREDLTSQFKERGSGIPLFAHLSADYPSVEVVWIDEDMERDNFIKSLESLGVSRWEV